MSEAPLKNFRSLDAGKITATIYLLRIGVVALAHGKEGRSMMLRSAATRCRYGLLAMEVS